MPKVHVDWQPEAGFRATIETTVRLDRHEICNLSEFTESRVFNLARSCADPTVQALTDILARKLCLPPAMLISDEHDARNHHYEIQFAPAHLAGLDGNELNLRLFNNLLVHELHDKLCPRMYEVDSRSFNRSWALEQINELRKLNRDGTKLAAEVLLVVLKASFERDVNRSCRYLRGEAPPPRKFDRPMDLRKIDSQERSRIDRRMRLLMIIDKELGV